MQRGIRYGGDYNPEQWSEDTWVQDVELMAEAGVNLVTLAVFGWGELQAGSGEDLNSAWLDRVMDLLSEARIGVDLATGTASPPPWLIRAHPEILPVTSSGVRLSTGGRQHYCPSSPVYRDAACELASKMAERYGGHTALELWHVGNEYGCHVSACYCDISAAAFRSWLRARYSDELDRLNEAWGTAFWSQRYRSFDEIEPPRAAPTFPNPSQQLDFARFCDDELRACYLAERDILRAKTPNIQVTTNLMGFFRPTNGWKWAEAMDLVSVDRYPDPAEPEAYLQAAMVADLTRSLGRGRPWYLMEQAPSAVNWRTVNVPKASGQFRAWSMQAVARGADAILQFQWRASVAGAEKFHSGMLPHAGTEAHQWRSVVGLGRELADLAPLAGTQVSAEVAILFDWESWWAVELDSHPADIHLVDQLTDVYRPLLAAGVTVDFVLPSANLTDYRLVVVPSLYLLTEESAANLIGYVEAGGVALVTYFSGIVDGNDHVLAGGYPAPWRDMLGLDVEEFCPLPADQTIALGGPSARPEASAMRWLERIRLRGAAVLLTVDEGPLAGQAAATVHRYGKGLAFYLATTPDRTTMRNLVVSAVSDAGVPTTDHPEGIEVVGRGEHLFVVNHASSEQVVDIGPRERRDILTDSVRSGAITMPPQDVIVLAPASASPTDDAHPSHAR